MIMKQVVMSLNEEQGPKARQRVVESRSTSQEKLINDIAKERERYKQTKQISEQKDEKYQSTTKLVMDKPDEIKFTLDFLNKDVHGGLAETAEEARQRLGIVATAKGSSLVPAPVTAWNDPLLSQDVFPVFYRKYAKKLDVPTAVQSQLWPCMLSGADAIAVAPTGSGKTLAFALPLAVHVLGNRKWGSNPSCLVLAPTRELVSQIAKTMRRFPKLFSVKAVAVYGGEQYNAEDIALSDVIVATPGRCLDIANAGHLVLKNISCLVMDEADRMLQLGFQDALEAIIPQTQPKRQTIFTTATWTELSIKVATRWMKPDHVDIIVGSVPGSDQMRLEGKKKRVLEEGSEIEADIPTGGAMTLSKEIEQIVHVCAEHKKPRKLIRHIERVRREEFERGHSRNPGPMLIFCNKIKTVLFVYEFLARQNVRVGAIHGSMLQDKRERALAEFRAGKFACLVATDVAGRGLHIPNLVHVVNYDFPTSLAQYSHRVGRCGRGKLKGTAFSFFTRNLAVMAPDLCKLLEACNQYVDPNLKQLADDYVDQGGVTLNHMDLHDKDAELTEEDQVEADAGTAEEQGASTKDDEAALSDDGFQDSTMVDDDGVPFFSGIQGDDLAVGGEDDDSDYLEDAKLDSIGAVPLKPFKLTLGAKGPSGDKKNKLKRPRGVRGGKKSKSKRTRASGDQ